MIEMFYNHGMIYGKYDTLEMEMFAPPHILADTGLFDDEETWPDIRMTFTVPFLWAIEWMENRGMKYDNFFAEYTLGDAQDMYDCACNDGVIVNEYLDIDEATL